MAMTLDGSNGVTFNDSSLQGAAASPYGLKNRIINGDMRIDQRRSGSSVSIQISNPTYTLDRWGANATQNSKFTVQQNAGSVTPPVGFTNYLGVTSSSAYSLVAADYFTVTQRIEGYNFSDLGWGTANAKTVTLSFWVRSSLTGTFGGCIVNGPYDQSYPFTYTISAANTWEQKTITIPGATSGTWTTTNDIAAVLFLSLGTGSNESGPAGAWASRGYTSATGATSVVGTNGATFYVTGVQFELGSTATPFERRMYGTELALCQRYFYKVNADATYGTNRFGSVFFPTTTIAAGIIQFPVTMRTFPTGSYSSLSDWTISASVGTLSVSAMSLNTVPFNGEIDFTVSGATAGQGGQIRANTNTASISFSAEL